MSARPKRVLRIFSKPGRGPANARLGTGQHGPVVFDRFAGSAADFFETILFQLQIALRLLIKSPVTKPDLIIGGLHLGQRTRQIDHCRSGCIETSSGADTATAADSHQAVGKLPLFGDHYTDVQIVETQNGLFGFGVLPYYLHQLDRVQGAAHFAVEDDRAMKLVESLRSRLPGYLVPKLVREKAGAPYKLLMG